MSFQREFNGACEPIKILNCDSSIYYPDPCDCAVYYRCINNGIINTTCAEDTLWDIQRNSCIHQNDILLRDNCTHPWSRCNVSEHRQSVLQAICTNTTIATSTLPSTTVGQPKEVDGGGINPGLVVGLIVAGAVLAVIVIAVIFIYLRRRNKTKTKKRQGTVAHNPEYFEGGNEQDPYDFINDTHMTDPTYQGESAGFHSNGSVATSARTGTLEGTAVYDNSATRESDPSTGYTSTLSRPESEQDAPYTSLNRDNNSNDIDANTPNITSDGDSGGQRFKVPSMYTDTVLVGSTAGPSNATNTGTETPDYYTLTREET